VAWLPVPLLAQTPEGAAEPFTVYTSTEDYEIVRENLEIAITDRGLVIGGVLRISAMLDRTGKDLGFEKQIYRRAESVEFCSAMMTYRMAVADPRNVASCPFTITIFERVDDPGRVHVVFQNPRLAGDADKLRSDVLELLNGIVREALD
jgi:hypothetical protein